MGSRSKIDLAYIAGFLDGDGSLMLQLKKRLDGKTKVRFMGTICFYQDTRHEKDLHWIRSILGVGYLSKRNDGMSELRINGYESVKNIVHQLLPYIKFKRLQARALYKSMQILSSKKYNLLSRKQLATLVDLVLVIQGENYVTKKKKTRNELFAMLGLTP